MNNYEHISDAIKLLKENEILEAKAKIKQLFDDIPCLECFLRKVSDEQKKEWDKIFGLKQSHHKYNGSIPLNNYKNYHSINSQLKNLRTYYNHVVTSILLICEENYEKANELLTKAIERNEPFDCDIALSLRALNEENNKIIRLNDIQRATILNPCSKNFKQLASFYNNDQLSIWDYYMESALTKNPHNQCALNQMINRIDKIKFEGSYPLLKRFINRYKKMIEEDGEQFPLILIATCYLKKAEFLSKTLTSYDNHEPIERPQENEELLKLYTRALDVAEKGKQFFPNINLYDSILSKIHLNLKNFDLAQKYASNYLQFLPNDKAIQQVKKSSKKWEHIHLSIDYFKDGKYDKIIELLDEVSYSDLWNNYLEQSRFKIEKYKLSKVYTESLIKTNDPDFKLKNADYYKKIKQLRESYNSKKEKEYTSITEDEENASNIKLLLSNKI